MSLHDDASIIFLASAAAGVEIKDSSKAPCVKPVEQLTGSEKVINGDFDSDSDWTKGTGWSISGGIANCSGAQTGNTGLSQLLSSDRLEDGSTYKITYTISNYVAGQVNPHLRGTATGNTTGNGTRSVYGVAGSDNSYDINFFADSSFNASIDNVSIKKVTTKAADFTISRDANLDATRVGPTGLIEKGRENLITYSNQFDNAIWDGSSTFSIGQEGYDGTNNAWRFTKNSDTGSDFYNDLFSGLKTFSIHAKKESGKGIAIYAFYSWVDTNSDGVVDSNSGNDNCFINLETGAIASTSGSPKHVQVDAVGNDFWRISMTVDRTNARWYLYTTVSDSLSATSITIQDAQLEVGIAATEHIPTGAAAATAGIKEDEPRFDYPLAGGAPSLLLEPERQNLVLNSEYIGGSTWTDNSSDVTVVTNDAVSPEGVKNAAKLVIDNTISSGAEFRTTSISVTSGKVYAFSIFAKADGFNQVQLDVFDSKFGDTNTHATLSGDGSITSSGADTTASSIENYGNGWYRIILIGTCTSSGTTDFILRLQVNGINGTGDGSKGILVYGAQVEEGSSATSYIPTHGAAATRSRDDMAPIDTSGFSFGTTCTIFFEGIIKDAPNVFVRPITMFASHSSPNSAERFLLFTSISGAASGTYTLISRHNTGTATKDVLKSGLTLGSKLKCASVIDGTSQKFFVNGALVGTNTHVAASIFNSLDLTQSSSDQNHTVGSAMIFNSALSDVDALVLTDTNYGSYSEMVNSLSYNQHG